jgi:NADP-dependent 3-hydroxy acid dehydrogenase YdfG
VQRLKGKIAWVTGAGTGIGEAAAVGLAAEGAHVILSGRRAEPLETVAKRIKETGGVAETLPVDLTQSSAVEKAASAIQAKHKRIDILVNNAGVNIPDRSWQRISPEGIDTLIHGNLSSAAYVARAVLPIMRAQKDGLMVHTASWAGRYVGPVPGPLYIASKHAVVAMSHSINLEECQHGIRSSVVCPGEVATPIMTFRDPPEPPEALARMLQSEDLGNLIVYLSTQPPHVCINEVVISPTHNRGYIGQMRARQQQQEAARKK